MDALTAAIVGLERPFHGVTSDGVESARDYTGAGGPGSSGLLEMRAFRRLSTSVDKAVENAGFTCAQSRRAMRILARPEHL